MEIRPLEGPGPWSLVDVADAAGVSYDMVYRDIRQGILPALRLRRGPGHSRYAVSSEGLRKSARPCYRHAMTAAIEADLGTQQAATAVRTLA
jgi:hypothetical protein